MSKVAPFHTDSKEYLPQHRGVYHDHDDCFEGNKIQKRDRQKGTGGKERCGFCVGLD